MFSGTISYTMGICMIAKLPFSALKKNAIANNLL